MEKSRPKLTIGMAHHSDFHGVFFTVSALQMQNPKRCKEVELVIIDNSAATHPEHTKGLSGIVDTSKNVFHSVKYVRMDTPVGTSPSRNRIFEEASGIVVLAMDCHVVFVPGFLDSILDKVELYEPGNKNIYSGPLVYDHLHAVSTHFDDSWRSEMWGIWGTAYRCECSTSDPDCHFSTVEINGKMFLRKLQMGLEIVTQCPVCKKDFPAPDWAGHEKEIDKLGLVPLAVPPLHPKYGTADYTKDFEIPGQGLGMFIMQKDSWPGFHPMSRQFGGEELYIHEKVRQRGGKAICVPMFGWKHRFYRPEGVRYPIDKNARIRNYCLELVELGMPLDPVYKHFVESGLISEKVWAGIVQDTIDSKTGSVTFSARGMNPMEPTTAEDIFNKVQKINRDLNQHMPILTHLVKQCNSVAEVTFRRESTIALLMGRPKFLFSYTGEFDGDAARMVELVCADGQSEFRMAGVPQDLFVDLPSVSLSSDGSFDMLFVDTKHTYKHVKEELTRYSGYVRKYIVLHDTDIYGEKGDDGTSPGLNAAIVDFQKSTSFELPLCWLGLDNLEIQQHVDAALGYHFPVSHETIDDVFGNLHGWNVVFSTPMQYGLVVLSPDLSEIPVLVGQELKSILKDLGQQTSSGCDCNQKAMQIDAMGVFEAAGKVDEIEGMLRDGMERWGWAKTFTSYISGAFSAISGGYLTRINPANPLRSAITIAIERSLVRWVLRHLLLESQGRTEESLLFKMQKVETTK